MTIQELEQFIATYGTDIYSFCVYLTGNRPEAEELYQDTFLKTLELLDKIQKDGNPKSYLLSVAIRIWKNRNRKINRRNSIAPMESEEPMEPAAGGNGERSEVEDHLLKKEEIRYVQTTLRKLPEKYRIPLCLYYREELTIEDIAGCLRIPQGTVKSRLHKAREKMKEHLQRVWKSTDKKYMTVLHRNTQSLPNGLRNADIVWMNI